jgi:hypothetical protein
MPLGQTNEFESSDEGSMLILRDRLDVLVGDHPLVADEDVSTEPEALARVVDVYDDRAWVWSRAEEELIGV